MKRTVGLLVVVTLAISAHTTTAGTIRSLSGVLSDFDEEGTLPQLGFHYARGQRTTPWVEVGVATLIYVNLFDADVTYPIPLGSSAVLMPKIGLTLSAGPYAGTIGLGYGARLLACRERSFGFGVDFMYHTFPEDDVDSAFPVMSGSVGVVWRR